MEGGGTRSVGAGGGGSVRAVSNTTISYGRAPSGQAAVSGDDADQLGGPPAPLGSRRRMMIGEGEAAIRRQSVQASSGGGALMPPPPRQGSSRRASAEANSDAVDMMGAGGRGGAALAGKPENSGKPSNPFESAISVPFGRLNGPGIIGPNTEAGALVCHTCRMQISRAGIGPFPSLQGASTRLEQRSAPVHLPRTLSL